MSSHFWPWLHDHSSASVEENRWHFAIRFEAKRWKGGTQRGAAWRRNGFKSIGARACSCSCHVTIAPPRNAVTSHACESVPWMCTDVCFVCSVWMTARLTYPRSSLSSKNMSLSAWELASRVFSCENVSRNEDRGIEQLSAGSETDQGESLSRSCFFPSISFSDYAGHGHGYVLYLCRDHRRGRT